MKLLQYKTKDYYAILGIPATTEQEEIKHQFFHLAKQFHPDVNHEPGAADKFKEINEAFQVIGNNDERKIYDQIQHATKITADHFTKTAAPRRDPPYDSTTQQESTTSAETDDSYNTENNQIRYYRKRLIFAAIRRIIATILVSAAISVLYVLCIEIIAWSIVGFKLSSWQASLRLLFSSYMIRELLWNTNILGGVISSVIIGTILGIDFNFKIETFITNSYMKKTYHVLRTLLFTLSFAFLFVLLNIVIESLIRQEILLLKIVLIVLGLSLGSTISSDGNFAIRIKTKTGWKELGFIFLRNIGFGLVGAIIGALLGLIVWKIFSDITIFTYMPLTGFALLTALGSTSEEEINTIVHEIDTITKKTVFVGIIGSVLLLGCIIGFLLTKNLGW